MLYLRKGARGIGWRQRKETRNAILVEQCWLKCPWQICSSTLQGAYSALVMWLVCHKDDATGEALLYFKKTVLYCIAVSSQNEKSQNSSQETGYGFPSSWNLENCVLSWLMTTKKKIIRTSGRNVRLIDYQTKTSKVWST